MLMSPRVGSTRNLHPLEVQMSGPLSRYWNLHNYNSWCIVFISIAPPNMRLQVEAQLRTPGIIACSLVEYCSATHADQRYISINIFPSTTLKEPGFNDDKDYSIACSRG